MYLFEIIISKYIKMWSYDLLYVVLMFQCKTE